MLSCVIKNFTIIEIIKNLSDYNHEKQLEDEKFGKRSWFVHANLWLFIEKYFQKLRDMFLKKI